MDLKNLLGKLDIIEGTMKAAEKHETGPKFTGYWKGKDSKTPGKHMVGGGVEESMLKDLSKGPTPKTVEQQLAEMWAEFNEEDLGVNPKRPSRKNSRPARGHEPLPRYKTVKTDEAVGQQYTVIVDRKGRERPVTGTMEDLLDYFGYTLEVGKSYEHERGRYKINMAPKNVQQLVDALNKAVTNAAANSAPNTYYSVGGKQMAEGWESGPPEYKEPYDDADDAYDRRRQEKMDIEAEKANAKRPQEKVYTLLGRGPNMEPNYKFPGEYKSQADAIAAREKIMTDPNTPHPEHIGIHSYTRYLDQANENSVTTPKNPEHAKQMMKDLGQLQTQVPNPDPELAATIARRKDILMKQAKKLGIDESRAHKILDKWFKDRELQDKFARGELNIPTPQERRAELEKSKDKDKKQVKEYGANQPAGTAGLGKTANDPKQAQAVAQATQTIKAATGAAAPTTNIAKAIDAASQGKPVGQVDMKVLEPVMKDVATIAQDPKLAGQFKTLVQQVNQAQLKQQKQQ